MAVVAPPAPSEAADLLKNLSLDSETKTFDVLDPTKKSSAVNGKVQPSNFMDPASAYFLYGYGYTSTHYYYGGYDGTANDWSDYSRYVNPNGVDLALGVYGYGYGYTPYGPYSLTGSLVPTVGHDGQPYGVQNYQYTSSCFQPLTPTSCPYTATVAYSKGFGNGAGPKGSMGLTPMRPTPYQNSAFIINGSYGRGSHYGYLDLKCGYDGVYSSIPWSDGSLYHDPRTRNNGVALGTQNHLKTARQVSCMNTTSGYTNQMYPNKLYGTNAYNFITNVCGWLTADDKFKPRGRANGFFGHSNENSDGLSEPNCGPGARPAMNGKQFTPISVAVKGHNITMSPPTDNIENESKEYGGLTMTPCREKFNKTEFPETYPDAKFFIIKSDGEDDIHQSIKYNVWASTQNGSKRLEAAYHEAQQKSGSCPVFLFFSVNASRQFVGVAEMVGPVDFDKTLEYWLQDKWIGCFPVKWHIVKDIPNSLLRHIILENNENKPVTNSRDTQEVKLKQGLLMIKIFKYHSSKQCILDDFKFYENRQREIQEIKKDEQQRFQKHAWEGKPVIDEKFKEGKKAEVTKSDLVSEAKLADGVQINVAEPTEKKLLIHEVC